MTDPRAAAAAEELRNRGYFLGPSMQPARDYERAIAIIAHHYADVLAQLAATRKAMDELEAELAALKGTP